MEIYARIRNWTHKCYNILFVSFKYNEIVKENYNYFTTKLQKLQFRFIITL